MKKEIRCKCGKAFRDDDRIRKDKYGNYPYGSLASHKFRNHIWNVVRRAKRNHFKTIITFKEAKK